MSNFSFYLSMSSDDVMTYFLNGTVGFPFLITESTVKTRKKGTEEIKRLLIFDGMVAARQLAYVKEIQ